MRDNLFICLTPYHIFFVLNFIKIKNIKNLDILILNDGNCDQAKVLHYLNILKDKKDLNSNILNIKLIKKNKFFIMLNLIKLFIYFFYKNNIYSNVYIANIINLYSHYILSLLSFKKIYTFDDGVANLNRNGPYFYPSKPNFIRRLFVKYDHNLIREKTACHYTVYNNIENIVDRIEYINVLDSLGNIATRKRDVEIYFIGQPVDKMNTDIDYKKIEELMDRFNITYYFSHPSEKNLPFNNLIETKLIGEDFFIERVSSGVSLKLYGFYSSILFNMSGIDNIEVYALYDKKLHENNKYIYDLMLNLDIKLLAI